MNMRKRKWIVVYVLLLSLISGCGNTSHSMEEQTENTVDYKGDKESSIETDFSMGESEQISDNLPQLGSWNYVTFTNQWSNINMKVPENAAIFTREQFPLFVTVKENQLWDTILMLNDWDSSIYIFYEKKENNMDIDTFLQQKFSELEAPEDLKNQINSWSDTTIGEERYRKLETSIRNDKFTDFYVREKDGYFIVIQTKSTPFKVEEIKHIIETISPVKN